VDRLIADDLNRLLALPRDTWILDYHPTHAIAGGFGALPQAQAGPSFTLIYAGRIVAIWGLVIAWTGLAEGWMVAHRENIRPIGLGFTRGAARFLEAAHERLELNRVQIHVEITSNSFCQWAKVIGFREEAVCKRYLPDGSDVILMAKTWG
jgi:hypothetical protein